MKADYTKILLAEALVLIMNQKPLDKISISEIISVSDTSRRTFYYHFEDKQALVCWVFDFEVSHCLGLSEVIIEPSGQKKYFINALRHYLYSNRAFYVNAIRSTAQNGLRDHIYEFIYQYRLQQIMQILGDRKINQKGIEFLTSYFTHAIVGNTMDWVESGMNCPPNQLDGGFSDVTTRCMRFIINEYSSPNSFMPM